MKKEIYRPNVVGLGLNQITELVTFWQNTLLLGDWDVSVELADPRTMSDAWATCAYDSAGKDATIRITTDITSLEDLHSTIIHELLHLRFWWITYDREVEGKLLEQALETITPVMARLFLGAKPTTKRKKRK